ncbi:GtrA family protein [bacterium]|nr:GtrA family protein [bacterium]
MFKFIKEKFFTKNFLIFCVIGVINTVINFAVMKGMIYIFDISSTTDISTKDAGIMYYISMGTSTLLAFLIASLFSYFANARFTYNERNNDTKTFLEAFLAFILRFVLTYLFTLLIWYLAMIIFSLDSDPSGWLRTLSNLVASIILIPPFYIALGFVFKRSRKRKEEKENINENNR